jgi:hypothetical protein
MNSEGMEYRRNGGAVELTGGIVFRLKKNEKESGCMNDGATENDSENNSGERKGDNDVGKNWLQK